jgi:hypothetical protein
VMRCWRRRTHVLPGSEISSSSSPAQITCFLLLLRLLYHHATMPLESAACSFEKRRWWSIRLDTLNIIVLIIFFLLIFILPLNLLHCWDLSPFSSMNRWDKRCDIGHEVPDQTAILVLNLLNLRRR